jgi:hypothetical protein
LRIPVVDCDLFKFFVTGPDKISTIPYLGL